MICQKKNYWRKCSRTILIALVFIGQIFFVNLNLVQAASYRAGIVVYSPKQKITLKAGIVAKLRINYINNGTASWLNSGTSAVKLKTDSTGKSFVHSQWISSTYPTKLYYPKVGPGQSIWFDVPIITPKTNGTYPFNLSLIAGSTTISGSTATFTITITGGKAPSTTNNSAPSQSTTMNGLNEVLQITEQQKTNLPITVEPNISSGYQVKFNGQAVDVNKLGSRFQVDYNFSLKKYFINDQNGQRILMTDQSIEFVPTNGTDQLKLTAGSSYNFCGYLKFVYQSTNSRLSILTNTAESCYPKLIAPVPTISPIPQPEVWWQAISADTSATSDFRFEQEPIIKVGLLYQTADSQANLPFKIHTLNNKPYELRDDNNNLLTMATTGDTLTVDFDFILNKTFVDSNGVRLFLTDSPLHFVAREPETIFEISSWKNGPFWGMNVNDNDYRGNLIVEYNPNTERFWLINEIGMEEYLRGNSEIWDTWPTEMLKAQIIAARTYALFRYINPKYTNSPSADDDPIFTVRSTQADQVYRGYQGELRNPNIVQAASDTRAMIATYNNDPILAYYFAQTNGRTRDSVSAGMTRAPVDYLKGVIDPPGEGLTLKGHGVGLPQVGGKVAAQQGANFAQILKYYYQGIQIKKLYP